MFKKGTIILIPFPFTDLSSTKIRPALIVSSNIIKRDDIVVVFISSLRPKKLQKTDIALKVSDLGFKNTGLKNDSIIKINKMATLDKKIVIGELGEIDRLIQKKVNQKIKTLFDL